jgi:D-serine dehydratase
MMVDNDATSAALLPQDPMSALRRGEPAVWLRDQGRPSAITMADVADAQARFRRFEPALRRLSPESGWDGRIRSPLIDFVPTQPAPLHRLLVKSDHALPLTGSIKARGGVHELLCQIERIALREGIVTSEASYDELITSAARDCFSRHRIVVASTGNLGFSIGLVGRMFGLEAEVHMSREAKSWKKDRLRKLGVEVVEHECDFNETVARARSACVGRVNSHFVDDETSRELFLGYATAGHELGQQLADRGIRIDAEHPLFVYLPCGVGGAPGGVTFALKHIFGKACVSVFAEPVGAASMFAAMSSGGTAPVHVATCGLKSGTFADGLAVPSASPLVLGIVGNMIDAVVAVTDDDMSTWIRRAWQDGGLRLEPAAAAGLAALGPFLNAANAAPPESTLSRWQNGVHVVWATGGSLLSDHEFLSLLEVIVPMRMGVAQIMTHTLRNSL